MSFEDKREGSRQSPCCPRCGQGFACGVGFPFHCDCRKLTLTQEELTYVRSIAADKCFCTDCLRALQAEFHAKSEP